jgi:hypothetical protein
MQELKQLLKDLASEIRDTNQDIKSTMKAGKWAGPLQAQHLNLKYKFRHHHIAYCMLRGRTYEQIESNSKSTPDFKLIDKIKEKYAVEVISPGS